MSSDKESHKIRSGFSIKDYVKLTMLIICVVFSVALFIFFVADFNNTTEEYLMAGSSDSTLVDSKARFRKQYEVKIQEQIKIAKEEEKDDNAPSGSSVNVKGDGQLLTGDANPYKIPLYDGLTMDAEALGCETYVIPYADNPFDSIREASQPGKFTITQENRRCEGGSASWNWYDEVNYSPSSKSGEIVPYTEVDGRMSIAVPWRFSTDPATYPLDAPAGNKSGRAEDVGLYYDIVFTDGTVLAAIGGSAKGIENDTNSYYQGYMHYQACPIEIVQYTDLPVGKPWKDGYAYAVNMCNANGIPTSQYGPSWGPIIARGNGIKEVVVYKVQHYTPTQGYKNWFTGD